MAVVAVIRELVAAGLTLEQAVMAAEKFEANAEAERAAAAVPAKVRSAGAERQARYRANLQGQVTPSDVTVTHNSDVTCVTEPPQRDNSNPPITSLRSDSLPERRERFDEFWSAYPKRSGSNPKQPAEEKFYRLVKASAEPAKLADEILDGARRYAASVQGGDPRFVAQAQTWLNQGRWRDDHTAVLPLGGPRAGPMPRPAPHNPRLAASRQLADFLDDRPR